MINLLGIVCSLTFAVVAIAYLGCIVFVLGMVSWFLIELLKESIFPRDVSLFCVSIISICGFVFVVLNILRSLP